MAVYVLGNQDQPSRSARTALAAGQGIKDITQTLFTLQQLQDKKAAEAEALKSKQEGLAIPLLKLQANQKHWDALSQQHAADREADAQKEATRREEEGKARMDLQSNKYELETNLARTKADLKAGQAHVPKPGVGEPGGKSPNAADESRLLAQDEAAINRGEQPTYLKNMSPAEALKFIKDRRTKLNAVSPIVSMFGAMGDNAAGAAAPQPDVGATTNGTKYRVVSP